MTGKIDSSTHRFANSQFFCFRFKASPNIVIALAGNKADLSNSRVVEYEEAKQYAEENGLLFMETSAKTAMNVNDIFMAIGMFASVIFFCISFFV